VQTAARGWPIRGDVQYDSRTAFGPPAPEARDRVIGLHARSLTFLHPIRYEPITLVAPLPDLWRHEGIAEPAG
jgi:23S rRNA pseudouridine1911/1915/1917 synthase